MTFYSTARTCEMTYIVKLFVWTLRRHSTIYIMTCIVGQIVALWVQPPDVNELCVIFLFLSCYSTFRNQLSYHPPQEASFTPHTTLKILILVQPTMSIFIIAYATHHFNY